MSAGGQPLAFQKPKSYDPALADRGGFGPTPQGPRPPRASDLGFDEGHNPELEERVRELEEHLEEAREEAAGAKEAADAAQAELTKVNQKIAALQSVNRSQTTLMKTELKTSRTRQQYTAALASRLRDQAEWFQAQSPALSLPSALRGLPTEEQAVSEEEIEKMQNRWECDVQQLQEILLGGRGGDTPFLSPDASPLPGKSAAYGDDGEARQRVADLEAAVKKQRREAQQMAKELELLRGGAAPSAAASATGGATSDLERELEAEREKSKDQMKKLKHLATAYKKIDTEKNELDAKLKGMGGAKKSTVSPDLLRRVGAELAASKKQVAELRSSVTNDMQRQFPALLQAVMQSQMPELEKLMQSGIKEWKDKYAVECDKRRKLHNLVQELKGNIRVYCRIRPLNPTFGEKGGIISYPGPDEISLKNEDQGTRKTWQFNEIFREDSTQGQLFESIRDLVTSMLDGYNVCIFAYGQTGSGKTFSMQGSRENPGVYMRTFKELFKVAKERIGWKIELKGALVEVYNEEIRDLLLEGGDKRPKLTVRQGKEGNFVPGLTIQPVASPEDVDALLETGQKNRTTAATDMNLHSSRSHLLVQIHGSMTTPDGKTTNSVITLVDLAGSERIAKSGVTGDRAKEAIAINKSLSALGDVINSRATKNAHTPYRNSMLTHLLQDSLGGDSKTLMLMQVNPCCDHIEETMCSLQFGARVNNVEMSSKK